MGKWQWYHSLVTWYHHQFFDIAVFLLIRFMLISLLGLNLWQFSFISDWSEICKLEIPLSEFCPTSRFRVKLRIPNLVWMSLMNSYGMLQNVRVTAFTELLRENQQCVCMGGGELPPRARSLVVSDLRSETKDSQFESGCQLCAEVSSLQ